LGLGTGPWTDTTAHLTPRTTLFLYSSGRDLDLFNGVDKLAACINELPPRRRNPLELCSKVRDLMGRGEATDDVAMLAVGVTPVGSTLRASTTLTADTTAPGVARCFIRDTLRGWSMPGGVVERAELCVSELVTNAVIHTGTAPEIAATLDNECLTVLVRDHGVERLVEGVEEDDPMRVSGRGLAMVEAMTSAWSAEQNDDGTTVWFEIELSSAGSAPAP
jgi:anti-sigma regulatory factor (Ser/Thr protein kinase)